MIGHPPELNLATCPTWEYQDGASSEVSVNVA